MTHRQFRAFKDLCYYSSLFLAMVYVRIYTTPTLNSLEEGSEASALMRLLMEVCFWGSAILFSMNALYFVYLYVKKPRKRKSP